MAWWNGLADANQCNSECEKLCVCAAIGTGDAWLLSARVIPVAHHYPRAQPMMLCTCFLPGPRR